MGRTFGLTLSAILIIPLGLGGMRALARLGDSPAVAGRPRVEAALAILWGVLLTITLGCSLGLFYHYVQKFTGWFPIRDSSGELW